MSNNPHKTKATLSKKHLDRLSRERRQIKWITIGAIAVIVLVIASIGYGILDQRVLRGLRSVAVVNGEKISANEFRSYTKYYRYNLVQNAQRTYEIASMFGGNPESLQTFGDQLVSISGDLETFRAGRAALDQMVADRLIRQEAKKLGLTVSSEEIEIRMQEALRYFANGTPTPSATAPVQPTSTLSPAQQALLPATPTIPATAVVTSTLAPTATAVTQATSTATPTLAPTEQIITATATPRPTETPYTFEAYQNAYATVVVDFTNIEIPETTLRRVIESDLYREKVKDAVIGQIPCEEDQVWAQHILVPDELLAQQIRKQLEEGEDWATLAATFSTDTSNKDNSGDLGWFGTGRMVKEFETAAFALTQPGQISQPVKSESGWHLIRLVARETRPLSGSECSQVSNMKFNDWLTALHSGSQIEINNFWQEIVPINPTLPSDIQDAVQQIQGDAAPSPIDATLPAP